jgi:ribosomal protein L11 methyltransferase
LSWLELKLATSRITSEECEALLWTLGALSVTMIDAADNPLFEPRVGETPLWDTLQITGLFEATVGLNTLTQLALTAFPDVEFQVQQIPEQDWERSWLDDFVPMCFGKSLWVCPQLNDSSIQNSDWLERHADTLQQMQTHNQVVLQLDPGLAFGTGTHPTTSLCLQWLDKHSSRQSLVGERLVDFGCGSGILALAALLLGASTVDGVDNDPQALQATAENCTKNLIDPQRLPLFMPNDFASSRERTEAVRYDGVMANILAGTLIELAPLLVSLPKQGGWLLLSGILKDQSDSVISAYTPWCENFQITAQEDWVCISATLR